MFLSFLDNHQVTESLILALSFEYTAGPTDNGIENFFQAGPGLGTEDNNGDRD